MESVWHFSLSKKLLQKLVSLNSSCNKKNSKGSKNGKAIVKAWNTKKFWFWSNKRKLFLIDCMRNWPWRFYKRGLYQFLRTIWCFLGNSPRKKLREKFISGSCPSILTELSPISRQSSRIVEKKSLRSESIGILAS